MSISSPVTRMAPAKVNLYLHVTGKREDGYHELDSLVVFAGIGDRITVEPGEGLSLTITGPFAQGLSTGEDNLVPRAARLLADHKGISTGAHLTLEKNLPVASGIGGGSGDAAATFKALVEFWAIELEDADIQHVAHSVSDDLDTQRALATLFKLWRDDLGSEMLGTLGLQLGADVPVCLAGFPAFMGGIGEQLEITPHMPRAWLVLVNPGVALSTPAVFKARQSAFSTAARFDQHPSDAAHLAQILKQRRNDLAAPAIAMQPVIKNVLAAIDECEATLLARMSGSGATCFGLYAHENEAKSAKTRLSQTHPEWWIEAAELLDTPLDD
ncbi:MAG: 4-(cytidine 5'-diphospho)-2-C-methyl-D-erythritol kinase [Magnetovibrio sp.]|nr:4-(cytidine 5'-diphospho)-2-C-methyl-D-erythritol kinase [Magnetovibrio sp.]